jgi:hypothetical protein
VPGARFVAAPPHRLGLPTRESHAPVIDSRNGWTPHLADHLNPDAQRQAEAIAAAAAAARSAAAASLAHAALGVEQVCTANEATAQAHTEGDPDSPEHWGPAPEVQAASAAYAAVVAAIESICRAGAMLEMEALPPESVLCALPRLERKSLAKWATVRVTRERTGCLQYRANRKAASFVIRGRVGGEICPYHATGNLCVWERCPYSHLVRGPVTAHLRPMATGAVSVTLGLTASRRPTTSPPGASPDPGASPTVRSGGRNPIAAMSRARRIAAAAAASAERDAELLAERTFGDVAQYETSVLSRPPSGYILIDVDAAAAVQVRLEDGVAAASSEGAAAAPTGGLAAAPSGSVAIAPSGGVAGAVSDGAVLHSNAAPDQGGAAAVARSSAESASGGGMAAGADFGARRNERRGWAKNGSFVLHWETYAEIATWLSSRPAELHAWVASECERCRLVPQPYAEAWDLVLQREAELGGALAAAGGEWSDLSGHEPSAQAGGEQAQATGSDAELATQHARLRRRIRHAMHLMMQQSNPHTYYAGVRHVCR